MPESMLDVLFIAILDGFKKEYIIGHHSPDGWNSCMIYNSHRLSNDESIVKVTHWMQLPELPVEEEIIEKKQREYLRDMYEQDYPQLLARYSDIKDRYNKLMQFVKENYHPEFFVILDELGEN